MSKSMSANSSWILLLAREPLKNSNADLSNAKDTLAGADLVGGGCRGCASLPPEDF